MHCFRELLRELLREECPDATDALDKRIVSERVAEAQVTRRAKSLARNCGNLCLGQDEICELE